MNGAAGRHALLVVALVAISAATVAPAATPPPDGAPGSVSPERLFTRAEVISIIGNARRIVAPDGIEELLEIPVGGTRQWLSVRGRNRRNPLLLVIHGGPASPEMPSSWFFQNGWEDYFTVVQWDQRGSGKSYGANDPQLVRPTLTLDRMLTDAAEVVQYLRSRYGKDKLFVLGHSWGSLVGLRLAHAHPEWLYAYIGTGQLINFRENERISYRDTLRAAERAGNQTAVAELKALAPYPEADGAVPLDKIGVERRWSVVLGGLSYRRDTYGYYENLFKLSPEYTDADVAAVDQGSALSLGALLPAMTRFDYSAVTRFACPILLFEGRHDETTPSEIAARWLARVRAPGKKLVWFEDSAHMVMVEEPGRFLVHLVADARPYAQRHPGADRGEPR